MDPISLVTSAKASIDGALAAYKVYKGAHDVIGDIEEGAKLLEINSNLLDAKESVLDLRAALIEKDEEILKLKEELKRQKEVVYEDPVYWHIKENGSKDGPFCQKCYDEDNKLIRLQVHSHEKDGAWKCTSCDNFYETKEYVAWHRSQFD